MNDSFEQTMCEILQLFMHSEILFRSVDELELHFESEVVICE